MTTRRRTPWSVERVRHRLGLPRTKGTTAVIVLVVFLGLALVSATLLADFVAHMGLYAPRNYEPKDFERGDLVERSRPAPPTR